MLIKKINACLHLVNNIQYKYVKHLLHLQQNTKKCTPKNIYINNTYKYTRILDGYVLVTLVSSHAYYTHIYPLCTLCIYLKLNCIVKYYYSQNKSAPKKLI